MSKRTFNYQVQKYLRRYYTIYKTREAQTLDNNITDIN